MRLFLREKYHNFQPPVFRFLADFVGFFLGVFDPTEVIDGIRQMYRTREGWLSPFPWCEEFQFYVGDIFTRLKVVRRKKTRREVTDKVINMSSLLEPHEECSAPRTVLIEGKPGMGKTTYCKKYAYDWATGKQEPQDCLPRFKAVLLLKCRDIKSNLWEAIDDQLLPRDIDEGVKEQFFKFIRDNQSSILLLLDGLDELPSSKLQMFSEVIEGRVLPKCYIVATARHEAGIVVRKCCDTLLEIEGFTEEHVREFITKYFKRRPDLADKLSARMSHDENLTEMAANPLNTALLCLLCEEFEGILPENRAQLYLNIVECVLRRYRKKKGLSETSEKLTNVYKSQLKHLGLIALNGLLEDKLDVEESELVNHGSDLPGFGFLSVQPGGSKLRPCLHYAFLHKSFQECFAAFYICCQIQDKEIAPEESVVSDARYFNKLKQVLLFACGIITMKYNEEAVALVTSIINQVNKFRDYGVKVVLEAINECKREQSDVHLKLARCLGFVLKLRHINLSRFAFGNAQTVLLAEAVKVNKTLTHLNLSQSAISDIGVKSVAEAIKVSKTLTSLDLSFNRIGDAGATSIAQAIKVNKTLTHLNLTHSGISDAGATSVAEAIKVNKTLSSLNLSFNGIGDAGTASIAEALKVNKTLTDLHLLHSGISDAGATSVAEAIKVNKTLTSLVLSFDRISDASVTSITEAIKVNKTLTDLNFSQSAISDAGATSVAEAIKVNKGLTSLDLSHSAISDTGATSVAEAIKVNKTLTSLDLSDNRIGAAGATSIAEAIKINKTLTHLNLCCSAISDAGATTLAEAIKVNKTVTSLDLSRSGISDAGATFIAEAIKVNRTLIHLNLSCSAITDAGATSIAEAIKVNKTLTDLNLFCNRISDASVTLIAEAIKVNKTLTQ